MQESGCVVTFLLLGYPYRKEFQMKKRLIALTTVAAISLSGCFGSYALTKKMHGLADGFGQPISTVLNWIPGFIVMPLVTWLDFVIFNTLEYWLGSNPLAMNEGEVEKQLVEVDGQLMEMTATKGQIAVRSLTGEKVEGTLIFSEADSAWYMERDGVRTKAIAAK